MTTQLVPWIGRQLADELFKKIKSKPRGVHIYVVRADAGMGKTYLARDLGTRLGSENGYEPGHQDDLYWSGIIDLYDPDTGNPKRIEQAWMDAFSSPASNEFFNYRRERRRYDASAEKVGLPAELEELVRAIWENFAKGMATITSQLYPVIAFDTIERLHTVADPAQLALNIPEIDPPDVLKWLSYQLEFLPRGVLLLLGRTVPGFMESLQAEIIAINPKRQVRGLDTITIEPIPLPNLSGEEIEIFFKHRSESYPHLKALLAPELKQLMLERTQGNPLLLDIAIQTLLVTNQPAVVKDALAGAQGIQAVERTLLGNYMQAGTPERVAILTYLAIATNGLSERMLEYLDPKRFKSLKSELKSMESLPFIKVRDVAVLRPGQKERKPQTTYFLHDEMYAICHRVPLIRPEEIRQMSATLVHWYDGQIQKHLQAVSAHPAGRRSEAITDLLVESLPYRMRAELKAGYQWYLEQTDRAIRSAERSLDSRLRDAMAQFISSAKEAGQTGGLPANEIDHQLILNVIQSLEKDYQIDSVLHWIKRFSVRGHHEKALEIANRETWVKQGFKGDRERYLPTYAELQLWKGQSLMYSGEPVESLKIYNRTLAILEKTYPPEAIQRKLESGEISQAQAERICLFTGRMYNNRGFLYWMYIGKYWLAIEEFHRALHYFDLAGLTEEQANSKDNIGRVYVLLGYSFPAFEAIREGLELRIGAKLSYREALSRNSLAIAYLRFENVVEALVEATRALKEFRHLEIKRGEALALTTRGLAYRLQAEKRIDQKEGSEAILKDLTRAEADLQEAQNIFSGEVQEPLRELQACNELACCYRDEYMLLRKKGDAKGQKDAMKNGKGCFQHALEIAEQHGFRIEKLDTLQDRAVLYMRAKQFELARADLKVIRQAIPLDHRLERGRGFVKLAMETRIDAYYKLMGQVELLEGAIMFEETHAAQPDRQPDSSVIEAMLEHYVLAVAYFNSYSGESVTNRQTNFRIYARLRGLNRQYLSELRDILIPKWMQEYNLPLEMVYGTFEEVFGLLIPGSKGRNWGGSDRR